MTGIIIADFMLLRRRAILLVGLLLVAIGALGSWITRTGAADQLRVVRNAVSDSGLDPDAGVCKLIEHGFDALTCLSAAPPSADSPFLASLLEHVPYIAEANGATSLAGFLGYGSRQGASMVGFIVATLIVSLHVAGEWESGTARPLLSAISPRSMFASKAVSAGVISIAIIIVGSVGVLLGSLIPLSAELPPPPGDISIDSISTFPVAVIVLWLVALIAYGFSLLSRSVVSAFAITTFFLIASYLAGTNNAIRDVTPAGWIADVMNFSPDPYRRVSDVVWIPGTSGVTVLEGMIYLVVLSAAVALGGAWVAARRRPLA